jgi:hypothetical protein
MIQNAKEPSGFVQPRQHLFYLSWMAGKNSCKTPAFTTVCSKIDPLGGGPIPIWMGVSSKYFGVFVKTKGGSL